MNSVRFPLRSHDGRKVSFAAKPESIPRSKIVQPALAGSSPLAKPYRDWFIGVDPGHSGALAGINCDRNLLHILDMPVRIFGATDNRREVDAEAVAAWLTKHPASELCLEEVWGMVGDGGVNGFAFGCSYGTIRGVAAGLGIKVTTVRPGIWKANLSLSASKDLSRTRACELFSSASEAFKRKRDDGRAEAALIAFYGLLSKGIVPQRALSYEREES